MAAEIKAESDIPLAAVIEAGYRPNNDWALYGNAWMQPTLGRIGTDLGARFRSNMDLYAGGWADLRGNAGAHAGIKIRF